VSRAVELAQEVCKALDATGRAVIGAQVLVGQKATQVWCLWWPQRRVGGGGGGGGSSGSDGGIDPGDNMHGRPDDDLVTHLSSALSTWL